MAWLLWVEQCVREELDWMNNLYEIVILSNYTDYINYNNYSILIRLVMLISILWDSLSHQVKGCGKVNKRKSQLEDG